MWNEHALAVSKSWRLSLTLPGGRWVERSLYFNVGPKLTTNININPQDVILFDTPIWLFLYTVTLKTSMMSVPLLNEVEALQSFHGGVTIILNNGY